MITFSDLERSLFSQGITTLAGIDEAGRGPLAGPVIAAAVIFPPGTIIDGIADSKTLPPKRRAELSARIRHHARSVGVGSASPEEIDAINILQASILAMHRAIDALRMRPDFLLVDGNRFHHPDVQFRTCVKGDANHFSIAAASIIAKVERDRILEQYQGIYPEYGFAKHKGYPTKEHVAAIVKHGYCDIHRRSFVIKAISIQERLFS